MLTGTVIVLFWSQKGTWTDYHRLHVAAITICW
jgi:hypothetical protein